MSNEHHRLLTASLTVLILTGFVPNGLSIYSYKPIRAQWSSLIPLHVGFSVCASAAWNESLEIMLPSVSWPDI